MSKKPVIMVVIAGGSGSGKTTVSDKLVEKLSKDNSVAYLSMDNYYKPLDNLPLAQRKQVNFDHPDALDIKLLDNHLLKLKNREDVEVPVYDYKTYTRTGETKKLKSADIILVDGILALHIGSIRNQGDLKLFIDTADDIRLKRRIDRDTKTRGRSVDSILQQYKKTVKPMHEKFVAPSKQYADAIVTYDEDNDKSLNDTVDNIVKLINEIKEKPMK